MPAVDGTGDNADTDDDNDGVPDVDDAAPLDPDAPASPSNEWRYFFSIDPAQDIAGGVVQAEVPGGYEALVPVLAEQDDRTFRVFQLHLPDDFRGAVLGHVVDHDDLVGGDRLVDGGDQALPNDAFLVVRRNNDGDGRRRRSIVWGIHGEIFG